MKLNTATPGQARTAGAGLSSLATVELSPDRQQILDRAVREAGGTAGWRGRKQAEGRDLLALSQLAPADRLSVEVLDLRVDLRAVVLLQVPVPYRPTPDGDVLVAPRVLLGIHYPQEVLSRPLPGFACVQILSPRQVWHANVAFDVHQPLCLGARLPAGIRVKELILMAYGALSLQTVMIDEQDAAGVMNQEAARWWQQNLHRAPLTRIPFLGGEAAEAEAGDSSAGDGLGEVGHEHP